MKEIVKVKKLINVYISFIKMVTGGFRRHPGLAPFSKTWNGMVYVYDKCKDMSMTHMEFIALANAQYDRAWVKQTFGTDYLPLNVLMSGKVRFKTFNFYRHVMQMNKSNRVIKYRETLKEFPLEIVNAVLAEIEKEESQI
jgi:hypothetical protein